MKTQSIFTFFAILILTSAANATVRTVNNGGGAQFTTIESAVVAAAAGDTVYINGSVIAYSGPTTRKANITFIGTGFNVQKQNPVKSSVNTVFNVGDNNRVIGLEFISGGFINYVDGISSLTISRCYLSNFISSSTNFFVSNLSIDHCIINNALFNNNRANNLVLSNNIFEYSGAFFFNNFQIVVGAIVDHCTFILHSSNSALWFTPPTNGFIFSNCVFYGCTPNNVSGFTYNNCYSSVSGLNGTGNVTSSLWPFTQSQGGVNTIPYNYIWDFQILAASAAHNAASDGTDMGALGGTLPFQTDGEPTIPQMDLMNIIGTQFVPGSTMQINFQSSVQD